MLRFWILGRVWKENFIKNKEHSPRWIAVGGLRTRSEGNFVDVGRGLASFAAVCLFVTGAEDERLVERWLWAHRQELFAHFFVPDTADDGPY